MKCLVLTPHRYGIKEVAERVGEEWERAGHDVEYNLPDGAAARVRGMTVGIPGIARWWQRRFEELARNGEDYDLIWTHQPLSMTVPDGSFWNQTIVTFHTTEIAEYRLARNSVYPRRRAPYLWFTSRLERWFYQRLEAAVSNGPTYTVVSPHLRDEIASFGIDNAVHVPNGVFLPDRTAFDSIRSDFGIPDDATVLFNVGSHTPQKRPVRCARQLNAICERSGTVHAIMAGTGPLTDDVRNAATNDRVHVRGYIEDTEKWRWFDDADVFVSLSAYEGMPVATLEALSFGVPVVLSDIPSHRAVIDTYDGTGAVVDGDASDLERAVRTAAGRHADVSLPTWDTIAEQYVTALEGTGKS